MYTEYGSGRERKGSALGLPATTCTWKSCHSFAGSRRDCGRQIGRAASASVCAGICCTTVKANGLQEACDGAGAVIVCACRWVLGWFDKSYDLARVDGG